MRRLLGYSLTGSVREHVLVFLHGGGRNGKSLYLNTVKAVLGDYATTLDPSAIIASAGDAHPTALTDLEGRRFVTTIEVADGRRFAEASVKSLTGGDVVKARRMRQDFYEFEPTHKIFLAANHKPEIRGMDEAIWRRVKIVPFQVTFVDDDRQVAPPLRLKQDRGLGERLAAEAPGILAAMVRGCLEWQRDGLGEPPAVTDATRGYRDEMDSIGRFLAERCTVVDDPALRTTRSPTRYKFAGLYQAYDSWARDTGYDPMSKRAFAEELTRRGFEKSESNGVTYRHGLGLVEDR